MKTYKSTDAKNRDLINVGDKLMDDAVAHCVPDDETCKHCRHKMACVNIGKFGKVAGLEPGEYLDPTSGYKLADCRAWVREEEDKMRQEREAIDAAEEEARIRAAEHHDDAPHESWCDLKPDDDLPF